MTRHKSLIIAAAVLALGVFTVLPNSASAHGRKFRSGYNYSGYNNSGWGGFAPTWNQSWHDTSHWDYHPTTLQQHGNHFHVQPGHYDWHQTGHPHGNHHHH